MTLDGYRQPACQEACDGGHNEHGQRTLWPDAAARDLGLVDLSKDGGVIHLLNARGFVFAPQREVEFLLHRYLPSEALLLKAKLRGILPLAIAVVKRAQSVLSRSQLLLRCGHAALHELTPVPGCVLASVQVECGELLQQ